MFDHIADLIRGGHIPTKVMVAGVDDEDIALLHFHTLFDHLGCVDIVITAAIGEIHDGGFVHQEI